MAHSRHLPDVVQEDLMHPDLYLRVYQQQERELTQRLANRLAARTRTVGVRGRAAHRLHLRTHRTTSHG